MIKIKELRLGKGFTQADLAKLLGVNQTAVGKYERGELEPNIHVLIKLSQIFETTVDYIIGNTDDYGAVNINGKRTELSLREKEVLKMFNALPQEQQSQLKQYLNFLYLHTSNLR